MNEANPVQVPVAGQRSLLDEEVWCSRCGERRMGHRASGWRWDGRWTHHCADLERPTEAYPGVFARPDTGARKRRLLFEKVEPKPARRESLKRFWRRLNAEDHPALRRKPRRWRRAMVRAWYGGAKKAGGHS